MADRRLPHLELVGGTGEAVVPGHDGECRQPLDGREVAGTGGIDLFHASMRLLILYRE